MDEDVIDGESVVRVRTMAELGPGKVVWLRPCRWCGGAERYMVLAPARAVFLDAKTNQVFQGLLWKLDRPIRCQGGDTGGIAIDSTIGEEASMANVWRVIDPILEQERQRAREQNQ